MKKIFLLTSIIVLAFSSNVFAQPTNLVVSNITTTSAQLNWNASPCTGNITLNYRILGAGAWTAVAPVVSPYALTGLTSNATYEWRLKCSGGSNPWSPIDAFTTLSCIYGCMNVTACNYNSAATCDNGSCLFGISGCTDPTACNYNSSAICDDGSCSGIFGCTNAIASNYNPAATCDNGSCITGFIYGCNQPNACNYNSVATANNGSCIFPDGCIDPVASNFDPLALCDDGSCAYPISGCTDPLACNYNPLAAILVPGSCFTTYGCTDPTATNYNALATCNVGCTFTGLAISNVVISEPILCNGGFALDSMQININQTAPATAYKCLVGYYLGNPSTPNPGVSYFFSYLSAQNTTASQVNLGGFQPDINYFVRIVDTLVYDPAHPVGGNGESTVGIIDEFGPIMFTQPALLTATPSLVSSNLCVGDCIAKQKLVITGGTKPYNYVLDANPPVILGSNVTTKTISSLCEGNYSILVSDANGCLTSPSPNSFTIAPISPIITSGVSTLFNSNGYHISCDGASDGIITASASGGTGGFLYSIDGTNFQSYPIFSGLSAGTYTITYKDANSCIATQTFTLTQPPALSGTASVTQTVNCYGGSGEITFAVTPAQPGVPPYQYSINNGNFQSSNDFSALPGGITYTVIIEDNNDCQFSSSSFLAAPSAISAPTPTITNVSCFGVSDGAASVAIPSGGTPFAGLNPYIYLWNPGGQITLAATGLAAGTYTLTITDANNCDTTHIVPITQPTAPLTATSSVTNVSCFGGTSGNGAITVTGGTAPYNVSWTGTTSGAPAGTEIGTSGGTYNMIGLGAGTYNVTVTDANNCDTTHIVTITQPTVPLTATTSQTNITCFGENDGTATATPIEGTLPYTYLWSNGQTTQTATNLPVGAYTCEVTDSNGCTFTTPLFAITQPLVLTATTSKTDIACNGMTNGTATANPSGGTLPYTYLWSNGQTTPTVTALAAGSYSCTITDANLCPDINVNISIINPDSLVIGNITVNPVTCFGECDASILSIQASGGTPFTVGYTYLYSVNGGQPHPNTSYFNGYCADTYTVQVRDVNNCVSSTFLIITEPNELDVSITTSLWNNYQIRCNGDSLGIVNITASGGTGPYLTLTDSITFLSTTTIDSLWAGNHTFIVEDASGCTYSETIMFNQPSPIQHNFIPTHVSCSGWSNGSLVDSVYGGVGDPTTYNYSWNTGEITYSIIGIPTGTYTITVTDLNNCVNVNSYVINDNNALSATSSIADVSCFDYCDGEITINVTGGVPNVSSNGNLIYYYQWNDTLFQTTPTAIGLCVNNVSNSTIYECIITDMQGCSVNLSATITQPSQLLVTASIVNEILCYDGSTGKLNATASGGFGSYQYMWSNNAPTYSTSPNNNGVPTGDYVITVKDSKGCTASDFITLNQPPELSLTISDTSVTCFGFNDGIIVADADGGTPFLAIPPEYLYTVTNEETGTDVYSATIPVALAENLTPGIYTIIAKDRNGCTIESGTIYISEPGDSLAITFNTFDASCLQNNGSATIVVYGGTPSYQYNWDNNVPTTTVNNINLAAGYYPITVIDSRGCEIRDSAFVKGTHNVFADSLSDITFNICLGDSVFITINETPFNTYVWENGSTITDRWVYPNDYINIYTLTIIDPTCPNSYDVVATVNVDFIDPMPASNPAVEYGAYPIVLSGDNLALYSENNSCVEYTWQWTNDTISNSNGAITITDLKKTDLYYLYVKDSQGCLGYDSIYVVVGVKPYEAITPNNDGFNDTWTPLDITSYEKALVQVFNRWGGLVFESKGGESYTAWDGTNDGEELTVGTYYYIIDLNTGDEPQTGPITIIR